MAKLWTVTVEVEMQVWAETEGEAEQIGIDCLDDELVNGGHEVNVCVTRRLPNDWKDAIPYGGDGVTTCEQLLAAGPAPTAAEEA